MALISELVLVIKLVVKSILVAIPSALTVKSIGLEMSKTSLSSLVVDQKVSYLRLVFSVSINSAPTKIVCLTESTLISFTKLPEMINLSLSVGSL